MHAGTGLVARTVGVQVCDTNFRCHPIVPIMHACVSQGCELCIRYASGTLMTCRYLCASCPNTGRSSSKLAPCDRKATSAKRQCCGEQLLQREGLRQRLLQRAGVCMDGSPVEGITQADALLLVSGSHPVRGALSWTGLLQDSTSALQAAAALRAQGLLPQRTALWAVANPFRDSPESLQRKAQQAPSHST